MFSEDFSFSMTEAYTDKLKKTMKGGTNNSSIISLDITVSDSENPFIATEEYKKVMQGGSIKINTHQSDSDSFGVTYHGGALDDSSDEFDSGSELIDDEFSTSSSSTDEIIDDIEFSQSEESDFTSYERYKKNKDKKKSSTQSPFQRPPQQPAPQQSAPQQETQSSDKLSTSDEKKDEKSKYVFSKSSDVVMDNNNYETSSLRTSDIKVLNVKSAYNKQSRSKKGSKKRKGSKKGSKN
jgi:hypothetical protein